MMGTNWWDFAPQMPVQQTFHFGGWACPSCRRCYSPAVMRCEFCGPPTEPIPPEPLSEREGHDLPAPRRWQYPLGLGSHACPKPRAGGMCGCDDEDDSPRDCLRARCDH